MRSETPRWMQVVGASDAGKTTLLVALIQTACRAGETVAAVKWSHHPLGGAMPAPSVRPVPPVKDAERLAAAGANPVYRVAPDGVERLQAGCTQRCPAGGGAEDPWPRLAAAWRALPVDWLLVEGGRELSTPKIVLAPGRVPPIAGPVALWIGSPADARAGAADARAPWGPPEELARLVWDSRGRLSRPLSHLAAL